MLKTEAQLEAEIAALLRKAELIDAQEDARYGKGKRGDELPKELQRRQDRLDALRKARAELEAEAAADNARRREQQARAAEKQAAGWLSPLGWECFSYPPPFSLAITSVSPPPLTPSSIHALWSLC